MTAWWTGLQPAEAVVDCGGGRHRVRWERGELTALDHADLEGERALAALGGDPCRCVEVLDAWRRYASDERVLVVASRGPADRIPRREWDEHDEEASGWVAYGPLTPGMVPIEPEAPDARLLSLLSLPGMLPERLVATVAASATASPRVHAALHGRVAAALREWLGTGVELSLTIGDAVALSRDGDAVRAVLPIRWLVEVWARGLATVLGRFCLAASTADGRTWELLTVTPELGPPQTLRLSEL